MYTTQILLGILILINLYSFFIIANDKAKSMRSNSTERIPEGLIFFLAALFGSIGVYAGMQIFRHKTRKWYFQIGIPLLALENLATLYIVNELLSTHTII